ncbi:hypothetical protein Tco_1332762, partial [Tanacetum coccineum]
MSDEKLVLVDDDRKPLKPKLDDPVNANSDSEVDESLYEKLQEAYNEKPYDDDDFDDCDLTVAQMKFANSFNITLPTISRWTVMGQTDPYLGGVARSRVCSLGGLNTLLSGSALTNLSQTVPHYKSDDDNVAFVHIDSVVKMALVLQLLSTAAFVIDVGSIKIKSYMISVRSISITGIPLDEISAGVVGVVPT